MATTKHELKPSFNTPFFHRSSTNKIIAGVAGGIGHYFAIDPTIIRLAFILLTVFGGSGIFIYLICWLIMPSDNSTHPSPHTMSENPDEISQKARTFASDLRFSATHHEDTRFWWGLIIIIIGFLALFYNFDIFYAINTDKLWPIILVVLGIIILTRQRK